MKSLTLQAYIQHIDNGSLLPSAYLQQCKEMIESDSYNAWISINHLSPTRSDSHLSQTPLRGAPIGIKDLIMTQWLVTTCGSKLLEHYVAPYDATCITLLQSAGGVVLGKTNLDEFAMGGSGEYSAYGPTINPYGNNRVAGGSSSGSAVAVALGHCVAALGTDTGGSIRQPAAFCGIVGIKPTTGSISRYGVQPMANSLDQVGVFAKTVADAELLLWHLMAYDPLDGTSQDHAIQSSQTKKSDWSPYRIAVVEEFFGEGIDKKIKQHTLDMLELWGKRDDIEIKMISMPLLSSAVAVYYVLMPAEASTNLAKFDGIGYGGSGVRDADTAISAYTTAMRSQYLGEEVKRRILLGTYVLSSGQYDTYYTQAKAVQNEMIEQLNIIYKDYDAIVWPTSPILPWQIGSKSDDPISQYLADMYTIPANLAGLPAMSIPIGEISDGDESLPVGLHIMTAPWTEDTLCALGKTVEQVVAREIK